MTTTTAPTAEQIAAILAFEAARDTTVRTLWSAEEIAHVGTGQRAEVTEADVAYDMAQWTTVANAKRGRTARR